MKQTPIAVVMAACACVAASASAEEAPAAPVAPAADKKSLQQAFDGAMTCSALAAIQAETLPLDERWVWDNRSFAFGMLAVRFWNDASDEKMTGKKLDEALNFYAGRLSEMPQELKTGFTESCQQKHADIDKLCEINKCIHDGPPGTAPAAPPPAPAAETP